VKDDRGYLEHIRDAINDIVDYTQSGRDAFFADRMRQDATIRKLDVIGEAVKSLSDGCKSRRIDVPWKQIAGMHDKVIHDYFGVNLDIVKARGFARGTAGVGKSCAVTRRGHVAGHHCWPGFAKFPSSSSFWCRPRRLGGRRAAHV
jgi:uncharacterized protein with HEPN domain